MSVTVWGLSARGREREEREREQRERERNKRRENRDEIKRARAREGDVFPEIVRITYPINPCLQNPHFDVFRHAKGVPLEAPQSSIKHSTTETINKQNGRAASFETASFEAGSL